MFYEISEEWSRERIENEIKNVEADIETQHRHIQKLKDLLKKK